MAVIKNIIFDLGGVLLNIDFSKTSRAFRELGVQNFDDFYSKESANQLFEQLETGHLSNIDFYSYMLQHCAAGTTKEQVQTAWNAILLDFRHESIRFLSSLQSQFRIYLLSNTNSIHHHAFTTDFRQVFNGAVFDSLFTKAYYSHQIGLRKPYASVYEFVLRDAGIAGAETLFIDDAAVNTRGAQQAGLHTKLLEQGETIEQLNWQQLI